MLKSVLALFVVACSLTVPASASVSYFLNSSVFKPCTPAPFSGSPVPVGSDEILSFGFGGVDTTSSTGGITGKPVLQNLTIVKKFDNCSGLLVTDFLTANAISQLTLYAYDLGGPFNPQEKPLLTITLSNAVITKYTLNSDSTSADGGTEQISLSFTKACIVTATTSLCYNVATNTVN